MKHLNHMGSADAIEVQNIAARRLLELINGAPRTPDQQREFDYCEHVLSACETVIEFLNAECDAMREGRTTRSNDREVFNTP